MKLILALAVAALSAPAVARPAVPVIIVVSTAGLDLTTASGQARLDRRIAQAAADACGTPSTLDLVGQNRVQRCRTDAVQAAAPARNAVLAQAQSRAPLALASAAQ